jgi:hypothetical protein
MAPRVPSLITTWGDDDLAERSGDDNALSMSKFNERRRRQRERKVEAERLAREAAEKLARERAERESRAALLRAAEEERHERAHVAAEKGKGKVSTSHFDFDFTLGRC